MANTIPTELQVDVMLQSALRAFSLRTFPLGNFSTTYRDVALQGTDKIIIPYYPLTAVASTDFNGTYAFGNTVTESREITINKRKYQSMSITSAEWNRQPNVDWELHGKIKGEKLAADVVADVLSVVTAANFGAAAFTGAASTFDSDDVADLRGVANVANWPKDGRSLVLDSAYDTALQKDDAIKAAYAYGDDGVIKRGEIPVLAGFDYFENPLIPANGENLVGFIMYRSALLVAFSPITPHPSVMEELRMYRSVTDPLTGLTLEYREWGNPEVDSSRSVIECNYGYAKGEAAALKRIVSA